MKIKTFTRNAVLAGLSALIITTSAFAGNLKFLKQFEFTFDEQQPFDRQLQECEVKTLQSLDEFIQMTQSDKMHPAEASNTLTDYIQDIDAILDISSEEYSLFLIKLSWGDVTQMPEELPSNEGMASEGRHKAKSLNVRPDKLSDTIINDLKISLFETLQLEKEINFKSNRTLCVIGIKPVPDSEAADIVRILHIQSFTPED